MVSCNRFREPKVTSLPFYAPTTNPPLRSSKRQQLYNSIFFLIYLEALCCNQSCAIETTVNSFEASISALTITMLQTRYPIRPSRSRISSFAVLLWVVLLLVICNQILAQEETKVIRCITEWGASDSPPTFRTIPSSQIDDGYCDCVYSALDEPNTSACSGIGYWAGLPLDDDSKAPPLP